MTDNSGNADFSGNVTMKSIEIDTIGLFLFFITR